MYGFPPFGDRLIRAFQALFEFFLRAPLRKHFFHDLEVVPLFGDMQIAPFNYVKRMKHYDASKWPLSSPANLVSPQVWKRTYLA